MTALLIYFCKQLDVKADSSAVVLASFYTIYFHVFVKDLTE